MEATILSEVTVAAWPGSTARLLREPNRATAERYPAYRDFGGYRPLTDPDALLTEVESSGLRGRGGAGFPLGRKLRTVRDNGRLARTGAVVIANGEEGEPASIKDRWLLRHRPHLILDGLRLAAAMVAADRGFVYVSDIKAARAVSTALGELGSNAFGGTGVAVRMVDPGYVAGEETAVVRALNGGPVKPTDKPPRPYRAGVDGLPTLVSNVETLANLPFVHEHGAAAFRSQGTPQSPGTFLVTITGAGRPPGLYEIPHGLRFAELSEKHGLSSDRVRGALMGGYFAGLLNRRVLDASLDHETLRGLGSGLGAGAICVLTEDCPVAVAASVLAYFDRENAGQCGSCFNGTAAMAAAAAALRDGAATAEDVSRLRRWSVVLRGRGACATLDAATNTAGSLLDQFPDEVSRHLDGICESCGVGPYRAARPYEVEAATPP